MTLQEASKRFDIPIDELQQYEKTDYCKVQVQVIRVIMKMRTLDG